MATGKALGKAFDGKPYAGNMHVAGISIWMFGSLLFEPFCAVAATPALTTYYWASNETSLVSGRFDDVENWRDSSLQPATEVPGECSLASFYHLPKAEYTVTLPEGVYTNYASLQIYSRRGMAVTIDGRESVFVSPTTIADNYSGARIQFYSSKNVSASDTGSTFSIDDGGTGDYTSGYSLSNVVWRFAGRWNSNASINSVEFRQGLFNFYDFDGVPHHLRLYMSSSNPNDNTQPISLTFRNGSSLRIWDFYPMGQSSRGHTLVNFDGGEHHIFGTFNLFNNKISSATANLPCFADVHIVGNAKVRANVLKVHHGATAQAYGPNQRTLVAAENGGTLTVTGGVQWATFNEQRLYVTNGAYCVFGPFDGSAARPVNNFADTAIQQGIGTNIVAVVVDNSRFDMVGDNRIGSVDISLHDSTFNLVGSASLGYSAKRSTRLFATNSTVAVDLDSGNVLYIGNSGTGMVELVDSDMTFATKTELRIGEALESCGEFVLDGGSFARNRAVQQGNRVYVGYKGSGLLTVKDGQFEAYDMFVHYDNSGTTSPTSIIRQTGGTIKITAGSFNDSENSWYAARIGQSSSAGVSKLVLDGGEFQCARLFATHSAIDSPTTGCHSYFEADGGTIVGLTPPNGSGNVITLRNFEKASLGSKGLTIRTSGETRTEQDFCDKEGSEGSGRLTLAGEGVKKLSGTNSTESVLVCAGGKTLFVPNATTGENARHYANVIVTNRATFSIAGDQTAATVRSLTLTRGAHLEMEKSDRLTVDGLVAVGENLVLDITDGASVGTYPLVVCGGEASSESILNWRRAVVAISGRTNISVTPVAAYDSTADKTTFSIAITEGGSLDDVTWNGTWNDVTGADRVTFAGGGTAAVAVDSDITVGALAFDSSVDYTLSGNGTLTFSDRGGYARIDVAQGEQTISPEIDAPSDLTLAVSSGAKLAVDGEIVLGGIIKEGCGTVSLGNAANGLSAGVTVKEGLLTAVTPDALGKGPITLNGGTLEVTGAGVVDALSVSLATEHAATAAVVKVEADVSMPSIEATQGAFIKRGTGRLTFASDRNVTICGLNAGTLASKNNERVRSATVFDGEGNYSVDGEFAFGGFNVAEGELVLRGTAPDVTFSSPAYVCIGIGTSQGEASPGLVVDHATMACSGNCFLFGTTHNSSFATAPYLIVTNKSTLTGTFICGWSATTANLSAKMVVDDSVQFSGYRFYPMRGGGRAEYVYQNGSALYVNNGSSDTPTRTSYLDGMVFDYGSATLTFSNSVLARKTALTSDVTLPVTIASFASGKTHDVRMRDGATLYCNWVTNTYTTSSTVLTVGFDDSEWKPIRSDETGDFTFDFPPYETVRIEMEGRGAVLAPAEGKTFTVVSPLVGEGGLRKRGAGTLAFACKDGMKSWDFEGTLSLEEGIVTLAAGAVRIGAKAALAAGTTLNLNGSSIEGMEISGNGTVANGTLASPTLRPDDAALPIVATDVVVTGRLTIDFGRTRANPLRSGEDVPIAVWNSTTNPSSLKVRVINTGSEANKGQFAIVDGILYCRLSRRGMIASFR